MTKVEVLQWLEQTGTNEVVEDMKRYGIPNDRAFGVPMGEMKKFPKKSEKSLKLFNALLLWLKRLKTGRLFPAK